MMVQIRLPQTINIPTHYTDHGTTLTAISSEQNISVKLKTPVGNKLCIFYTNIFNSIMQLKIFLS